MRLLERTTIQFRVKDMQANFNTKSPPTNINLTIPTNICSSRTVVANGTYKVHIVDYFCRCGALMGCGAVTTNSKQTRLPPEPITYMQL